MLGKGHERLQEMGRLRPGWVAAKPDPTEQDAAILNDSQKPKERLLNGRISGRGVKKTMDGRIERPLGTVSADRVVVSHSTGIAARRGEGSYRNRLEKGS